MPILWAPCYTACSSSALFFIEDLYRHDEPPARSFNSAGEALLLWPPQGDETSLAFRGQRVDASHLQTDTSSWQEEQNSASTQATSEMWSKDLDLPSQSSSTGYACTKAICRNKRKTLRFQWVNDEGLAPRNQQLILSKSADKLLSDRLKKMRSSFLGKVEFWQKTPPFFPHRIM